MVCVLLLLITVLECSLTKHHSDDDLPKFIVCDSSVTYLGIEDCCTLMIVVDHGLPLPPPVLQVIIQKILHSEGQNKFFRILFFFYFPLIRIETILTSWPSFEWSPP
jgi:hypothetical protein